mmetsp:Transcript_34311/g.90259  ORF Transcript_34311/g.90259 Transcript_34311/m.90259 type:complete len:226 (-) Transcript_34311:779-1456(-)
MAHAPCARTCVLCTAGRPATRRADESSRRARCALARPTVAAPSGLNDRAARIARCRLPRRRVYGHHSLREQGADLPRRNVCVAPRGRGAGSEPSRKSFGGRRKAGGKTEAVHREAAHRCRLQERNERRQQAPTGQGERKEARAHRPGPRRRSSVQDNVDGKVWRDGAPRARPAAQERCHPAISPARANARPAWLHGPARDLALRGVVQLPAARGPASRPFHNVGG